MPSNKDPIPEVLASKWQVEDRRLAMYKKPKVKDRAKIYRAKINERARELIQYELTQQEPKND